MPKKSSIHPHTWFSHEPQLQQIQTALPAARELLIEGFNTYERRNGDVIARVLELVRCEELDALLKSATTDNRALIGEGIFGAYTLGIAVGLTLNGQVFLNGGGAR